VTPRGGRGVKEHPEVKVNTGVEKINKQTATGDDQKETPDSSFIPRSYNIIYYMQNAAYYIFFSTQKALHWGTRLKKIFHTGNITEKRVRTF